MNLEAHRAMRREQIERWLACDGMGVVEWCKLNRMATSTFYLWLNRFREEEPEVFGERPAKGWVEVARQNRKDSVALAVNGSSDAITPDKASKQRKPAPSADGRPEPITVSAGGAVVSIPAGSGAAEIAAVIGAVMGR